jgi:hypothetical protein
MTPSTYTPHVYTHAACHACGRRWALQDGEPVAGHARNTPPEPLDGDYYTRIDADGIGPVALCPDPCGAFVYLEPSRWIARVRPEEYRVRWVYDPEPDLENPSGSPLPGPESEYVGNEIHELIDRGDDPQTGRRRVVPYAEYCRYWGNPERHTVLACLVERACGACDAWEQVASLGHIDFMDDDREILGLNIGHVDRAHRSEYYTAEQASQLPGYVGEVARDLLDEAKGAK